MSALFILTFYAENLFFVFYKIAIQICGNAKQNPGCIAVTAIQNLKGFSALLKFLIICVHHFMKRNSE